MNKRSYFFILICIFSIIGCMNVKHIESGKKWDDNSLFLIKTGETTAKDIAYGFGSPQKEIAGQNGRIWIYTKGSYKYQYEGNIRRGLLESEDYSLTVWFNKDGVVANYSLNYSGYAIPETRKSSEMLQNQETQSGVSQQ